MGKVYVCQPSTNHAASIFLRMLVTARPPAIHPAASTFAIFFHTNIPFMLTSSTLNIVMSSKPRVFECSRHKHSVRAGIAEKSPDPVLKHSSPTHLIRTVPIVVCRFAHLFLSQVCFKHRVCKGRSG